MKLTSNPHTIDTMDNHTLIQIMHRLEPRDRLNLVAALRGRPNLTGLLHEYDYKARMTARRNEARLRVAVHGDSFTLVTETGKLLSPIIGNDTRDMNYFAGVASVSTNGSTMTAAVSHKGRVYLCDCTIETLKLEPSFAHIVSISTGYDHLIAIDHNGVVYCLGQNDSGQCGLPIYGHTEVPRARPVPFATRVRACSVSAGLYYSLVVTEAGQVYAFGEYPGYATTDIRIVSFPDRAIVVSAAAGDEHALALTEAGEVFAWGKNYNGQLGIAADELFQPTRVFDEPTSVFMADMNMFTFKAVAASGDTSGAVTVHGRVFVWGELNDTDCMRPYPIRFNTSVHVTAISLNDKCVVCISSEGAVVRCQFDDDRMSASVYTELMTL